MNRRPTAQVTRYYVAHRLINAVKEVTRLNPWTELSIDAYLCLNLSTGRQLGTELQETNIIDTITIN